jgi:hypothetical protein
MPQHEIEVRKTRIAGGDVRYSLEDIRKYYVLDQRDLDACDFCDKMATRGLTVDFPVAVFIHAYRLVLLCPEHLSELEDMWNRVQRGAEDDAK